MIESWQIFFGIAAASLSLAIFVYFNHKKSGSMFSFQLRKGREIRLADFDNKYDYGKNNPSNEKRGKFDHLFDYGINRDAVSGEMPSESNTIRQEPDNQLSEVRMRDRTGLTTSDDIPKLREYRGEFDGSAKTILHGQNWNSTSNQNPEQKPKERNNSWTPLAFFSKD